jgi:hypothetical protein
MRIIIAKNNPMDLIKSIGGRTRLFMFKRKSIESDPEGSTPIF